MNPYRLLWTTALGSLLIAGCSSSDKPGTQVSRDSLVPVVGTNELPAGKWASPPKVRQKSGTLVAPGGKLDAYAQATTNEPAPPSRPPSNGKKVERNTSGDYNLNFVDVEVGEMARAVLRDVLQVAYLIDERVQGRVSIETPRPVQRDALITILEASLRSIGAGLVVNDDLYQIVPLEVAANQLGPLGQGSIGVVPVRLRFVEAEMLMGALAPFAQDLVGMSADPQRNMLILSGDRTQLGNLLGLIDSLDSNVLAETSFALTPLQMAEAPAVARELEAIFVNSGGIRFLPIDRQNAVLAIARNPEVLATSQAWIKRLDRRGGSNDQGIYVYQVESGDTAELAATVSSLFGLGQPGGDLGDFADDSSGIAPSLTPAAIGASAASFGENGEDQPDFAGAADPLDLNPFAGGPSPLSGGGGGGSGDKNIKIVPHAATNTIVVMSTEQQWNRIETTLRRLDQIPLQVMIEATVVEVTLNDDLRYGVQVALEAGNSLFSLTDSINLSAVGGNIPIPSGFAFALEAGNVKLLLDALSEITDIKVLTSPRLMVTSSKAARLVVGDQVPVPVQSATPIDSNNGFLVNTVEFRDTGVILDVTPRVSPSGLINLDINQEVSDVVPTNSSNIDAPTISQRQVASSVAVQSGETVILGGLTAETDVYATSRIPILGALPVVGPLFGSTVSTQARTELLVMIKPKIIRNADDARAVATELRQRLNRLAVPDQPFAPAPPPPSRTPPARTSAVKPSVKTTGL